MIERLRAIATILQHFKALIVVLGLGAVAVFVLSLLASPWLDGELWLIPSLIGICWALSLFAFMGLFRNAPMPIDPSKSWRVRTAVRFHRGLYGILAILVLSFTLALLILSYQLLRTWMMN
jgi:hypothetical protein